MSLAARLLVLTCLLAILGLPRAVAAQAEPDEAAPTQYELESRDVLSLKDEQRHGLQAARLSVTIAALNVPKLSIWGSIWLVIARDQSSQRSRRGGYAIGSIQVAGGVANLAWLVLAGQTLRDYKQHTGNWMTVRRARLDTAFSSVDTAFLLPGIIGGSIGIVRNRDAASNFDRAEGLIFLIPNLALLPFHVWALVANGTELRHRKRGVAQAQARCIAPTPSGFRF